MLRVLLLVLFVEWSRGDSMLDAALRAGAISASVCVVRGQEGCAGALWARYWLLARASCVSRASVARVPVLLYRPPEDCRDLHADYENPGGIEALVHFIHPSYSPPAFDELDPPQSAGDAAFLLLSAPAPPTRADNHTATAALLPNLNSWLRYVPAQVPWANGAGPSPPPAPRSPFLASPLRMLLSTIVAPVVMLLLSFLLLLRWPQADPDPEPTGDEKVLVESDALSGEAA